MSNKVVREYKHVQGISTTEARQLFFLMPVCLATFKYEPRENTATEVCTSQEKNNLEITNKILILISFKQSQVPKHIPEHKS